MRTRPQIAQSVVARVAINVIYIVHDRPYLMRDGPRKAMRCVANTAHSHHPIPKPVGAPTHDVADFAAILPRFGLSVQMSRAGIVTHLGI